MIKKKYEETLAYLYRQLPMYQQVGIKALKKGQDNILALMDVLGQQHTKFKSIHIAGTNGKGSVAHMLSAILQSHAYKVGLYTSPHYRDFRERIKINGRYIPRREVIRFVEEYSSSFEAIQPTYFEISVAMAFDYFAREEVDIAIIEAGLGGVTDSTNILTPILSVITNISFDHQSFLGNTLPLIAGHKAGIIKPGVPVVIGETHPETAPVFLHKAKKEAAPIIFADQHFQAEELNFNLYGTTYQIKKNDSTYLQMLETDLVGPYQHLNLQTVLQAIECLSKMMEVTERDIRKGLAAVYPLSHYQGRWQLIGQSPFVLCDSAHNEGGLRYVTDVLRRMSDQNLHIVLGMVKERDLDQLLPLFPPVARYYFARPDIPRGMDAAYLREKAAGFGLLGRSYKSVRHALRAAKRRALAEDFIFVGGSSYVVAEVLPG